MHDTSQTENYDKNSSTQMHSQDQGQPHEEPEIDKIQYLAIIQAAFSKIASSMHPAVANSLNQIRMMYDHLYAQIESNHTRDTAEANTTIEQLERHIGEIQSQSQNSHLLRQQIQQLIAQNTQLQSEYNAKANEARQCRRAVGQMRQRMEAKERQIEHFKQNIEDRRTMQNGIRNDLKIKAADAAMQLVNQEPKP